MGRIYNLPLARTSVTVAVDLVEILTPASLVVFVNRIEISQSTEVKDAEEEMLQLAWKSGQTTGGSGGTASIVPIPILLSDAAHGLTVEVFNTTKATAGTIVTHKVWDWNVRQNFDYVFLDKSRLYIPPSTRATLELVAAPGDALTIGGQIEIEIF